MNRISYPDVMIDIETLSTQNNAAILTIGAVKFDLRGGSEVRGSEVRAVPVERPSFYVRIDQKSCAEIGLHIDQKTINWWKEQDLRAQKEAFDPKDRVHIRKALSDLYAWLSDVERDNIKVWCQGANFDVPILSEAFRRCELSVPWKFYNVRDTRTLYDVAKHSEPSPTAHIAVEDCVNQIEKCKRAYAKIKSAQI